MTVSAATMGYIWITTFLFSCTVAQYAFGCEFTPFDCGCKKVKSKGGSGSKRLYCRQINVTHFLHTIRIPDPSMNIVWIDFSENHEKELSLSTFSAGNRTFEFLHGVEKLDISRNEIWKIAADTFLPFPNLNRLNLSRNSIGNLSRGMFNGLSKLQILDLSYNKFPIISGDAFLSLPMLDRVAVRSTDLVCNCLMRDFLKWMNLNNTRVKVSGTCHLPVPGVKLRSLHPEDMYCNGSNPLSRLPYFEMMPAKPQLIFEGDDLDIQCEGTNLPDSTIYWSFNGKRIEEDDPIFSSRSMSNSYKSVITGWLTIKNVSVNHSGLWNCTVESEHGSETRVLNLAVINTNARYCPNEVTSNRYGVFQWPATTAGLTKHLSCPTSKNKMLSATRFCDCGNWSVGSYESCPYEDFVTNAVNDALTGDLTKQNIADSMKNLVSGIIHKSLSDPIALNLIQDFLLKALSLLTPHNSDKVIVNLLDLVSYSMRANFSLIKRDELSPSVYEKITEVVRRYAIENASVSAESPGIALVTTTIHETAEFPDEKICSVSAKDKLRLSCQQTKDIGPQSAVFLPKSSLKNCLTNEIKIYYIVYKNGSLYQSTNSSSADCEKNATTPHKPLNEMVFEVGVHGCDTENLTEPIVFNFETTRSGSFYPAVWTSKGWIKDNACQAYRIKKNFTQVVCYKFVNVTLIYDGKSDPCSNGNLHDWNHPAVFTGTFILGICLFTVAISYLFCFRELNIAKEHRHMTVAVCLHLLVASFMFAFCIRRVDNRIICVICGVTLHYTSLAVLFWITLCVRCIHRQSVTLTRPPTNEPKPPKPMLPFYLVGCGIPVIICGITAAAKLSNYGGEADDSENSCWLTWETSIYAFYLPAALVALVCIFFLLRVLCIYPKHSNYLDSIRSPLNRRTWQSNSKATNMNEHYQAISTEEQCHCRGLESSLSHSRADGPIQRYPGLYDGKCTKQDIKSQISGIAVLFFLYVFTWISAALSVASPTMRSSESQDTLDMMENYRHYYVGGRKDKVSNTLDNAFSWVYAILAIAGGLFIISKYLLYLKNCRSRCPILDVCFGKMKPEFDSGDSYPKGNNEIDESCQTSSNRKSSLASGKPGRGAYTTIKTDPTMETMLNSTDNAENGPKNGSAHYTDSVRKTHFINGDVDYRRDMEPCLVRDHRRGVKSVGSHRSSYRLQRHLHNSSHSHMIDSSGHHQSHHMYTAEPCSRMHPYHLGYHNYHASHHSQEHGKRVKMTNLHMGHDSSYTEHSIDGRAFNNMHTKPVIMQHRAHDNRALLDRYQKVKKALERKRARQKKLNVLREYAHDPLTSNDEGKGEDPSNNKSRTPNESSPLIQPLPGTIANEMQPNEEVQKYRPLLLSPPAHRRPDKNFKNKNNSVSKRVKRLDSSGQARPIRADKRIKQSMRKSDNSTLSEREQETSSNESHEKGHMKEKAILSTPKSPFIDPLSVALQNYDTNSGQDNHGYLTLQQFQNANNFLFSSRNVNNDLVPGAVEESMSPSLSVLDIVDND